MKISKLLTDETILAELGRRIAQRRLELQLTQAALAEQAGVSKRTVERVESGASAQMLSMVRLFRVLDLVSGLEAMLPEAQPRPMDLLKRKGKPRQRAASRREADSLDEPWSWDDKS